MTETIYFKVKMEKNPDVMISGYVDINDEDVDWYYWMNGWDKLPKVEIKDGEFVWLIK